jgi:hypothetical protein
MIIALAFNVQELTIYGSYPDTPPLQKHKAEKEKASSVAKSIPRAYTHEHRLKPRTSLN